MNKITVLTNNVILIGNTVETADGVLIDKPHSIQQSGEEYILTPFLEQHIGQNLNQVPIKSIHIVASVEAENNELLQGYLQKISGIDISSPDIILG